MCKPTGARWSDNGVAVRTDPEKYGLNREQAIGLATNVLKLPLVDQLPEGDEAWCYIRDEHFGGKPTERAAQEVEQSLAALFGKVHGKTHDLVVFENDTNACRVKLSSVSTITADSREVIARAVHRVKGVGLIRIREGNIFAWTENEADAANPDIMSAIRSAVRANMPLEACVEIANQP